MKSRDGGVKKRLDVPHLFGEQLRLRSQRSCLDQMLGLALRGLSSFGGIKCFTRDR